MQSNPGKMAVGSGDKAGIVYTFYSYKGGVGRSMAVANVGVLLSRISRKEKNRENRVLLVDWDLEAPGLETFFGRSKGAKLTGRPIQKPGIIDLIESHADNRSLSWKDCLLTTSFAGGSLDIITAGRKGDWNGKSYRGRVQDLNWVKLYGDNNLGTFIDQLRNEWKSHYDFILIDSRTGVSDIGDICTVLLPDVLVLLFVSNYQNVEGIKLIVDRARSAQKNLPVDRSYLNVVPVPSRREISVEYDISNKWDEIFLKELGQLYSSWLPHSVSPKEVISRLFIPYVAKWSFGESLPVLENERELYDPSSLGNAYLRLANLLASRLDWYSIVDQNRETSIQKDLVIQALDSDNAALKQNWTRRATIISLGSVVATALAYGSWLFISKEVTGHRELVSLPVPILNVIYSPDGSRILTVSGDNSARLWSAANGTPIGEPMAVGDSIKSTGSLRGSIDRSVAFSPDGTIILTAYGSAKLWSATNGVQIIELKGEFGSVTAAAFSPDGTYIVIGSMDGELSIWETASGIRTRRINTSSRELTAAIYSADGRHILTVSGHIALLWDARIGKPVGEVIRHEGRITSAALSNDGTRIVTASDDKTARLWDAKIGIPIGQPMKHEGAVRSAAFSEDGTRIVTAADATARIWDANLCTPIGETMKHEGTVNSALFSPDGIRIVTASEDGTAKVWDGKNARNLGTISVHRAAVTAARFSPTGQQVITASFDGTVVLTNI